MATIGHRCPLTERWEIMGAADNDAFRLRSRGQSYEFKAPYGTVTVTCKCGYSEDVPLREPAGTEPLMQKSIS